MRFKNYTYIFVFLFCFVLLCYAPPPEEEMDVEKVHKAIEESNLKFGEAARQGDAAALAALYTEDATLLPPNSEMIKGREGIEAVWSAVIQMGAKDVVYSAQSESAPFGKASSQQHDRPMLVVQLGHSGMVWSVAFSPDGRYVLTGSGDDTAVLWDRETGWEVRRFEGHTGIIRSVAFSPDGRYVLTGSAATGETNDLSARLWDAASGKEVRKLLGHSGDINAVAFSPNGCDVLTGSRDNTARLWNRETGQEVRRFTGHTGDVNSVAFSPDGCYVLTGSDDKTARLWDRETGQEVRKFTGHTGGVTSVAFSPDGRYVMTGSRDNTARLWNRETGQEVRRFEGHISSIYSVAFSPDGRYVMTGSWDNTARLWDRETGNEVRRFAGIYSVAFSPDGRYVLTGSWDNTARLWDRETGNEVRRFEGHARKIKSVAFSPDGRCILTGSWDNSARLWDANTGQEVRRFKGHDWVNSVAFSPDGRYVLTGSADRTARLWDRETGQEVRRFVGHAGSISSVAFSPDGRYVLTGSADQTARLWDRETGKEVRRFVGHRNLINSVAFSPDGRYVLTGSWPNARLWDAMTGQEVRSFEGRADTPGLPPGLGRNRIYSVAFSPDGRYVLTGSTDKTARLWDRETAKEVKRFVGHAGSISSVAFSPDGRYVLTGSADRTARLWDAKAGYEVTKFVGHLEWIVSVALSPDGRYVLTGSWDGTARLWGAATGQELARLISFGDGTWVVMTPEGCFDTNNLEEIKGLHWIIPDDPLRPLPVEIFMRDYYEPQLLPRVLKGEQFKPIRPLAELNRVQPGVKILKVEQGATSEIAKVTVEVSGAEGTFQQGGKDVVMKTGVHDLRLYRNGQLVGQWPEAVELTYKSLNTTSEEELNAWRKATEIKLDKDGKAAKTFTVRLPRLERLERVEFSAYAFNKDRVKSETARKTFYVTEELKPVKGCAYIITVGVSDNEKFRWKLTYAAEDAKLIQKTLVEKLRESGEYEEVVSVPLITVPPVGVFDDEEIKEERRTFIRPTKENIKTVVDILAGRKVEPIRLEQLPEGLRHQLRPVQPEDMVLFSFSSHGVTDAKGEFYILPYDLGKDSRGKATKELLERSISSQELSLWLSTMDAEQMVMIIDACHSAAAVEVEGFKPGPMGNPGLGQLSYDKRMPILVATQATDSAWAKGYSLLTLALAKEGIEEEKAAKKGQLSLMDALKYAEERVPALYEEIMGKEETKTVQHPKLFDFRGANK